MSGRRIQVRCHDSEEGGDGRGSFDKHRRVFDYLPDSDIIEIQQHGKLNRFDLRKIRERAGGGKRGVVEEEDE